MRREIAALVALAVPAVASAYTYTGMTWTWQNHAIEDPWEIAADGFPDSAGTSADVVYAVETAMTSWNALGVDAQLRSSGLSTFDAADPDGRFAVIFEPSRISGGTLAYASTWAWEDGAAFDCDLTFLQSNDYGTIGWSANRTTIAGTDVQAVALHELGHCLGLGHSADGGAVMYAYYGGFRDLRSDDKAAVNALYGVPCADADGDGVRSCEGDCADDNGSVFPGSGEACNGLDDDCDGVVDGDAPFEVNLGPSGTLMNTGWASAANTVVADAPTRLIRVQQRVKAPTGARLVWTVYETTALNGPFTLVYSGRGTAGSGEWQLSPDLDLPLQKGHRYVIGLGVMSDNYQVGYRAFASRAPQGPITPSGAVYGRALGDENTAPDSSYLFEQNLIVVGDPDPDDDGVPSDCGDCAPDDAARFPGQAEVCDGVDQDCDGEIDEDFAVDTDSDGVYDCADPCPNDPADDGDGDGACADADPCPDDAFDTCDDVDTDTTGGDDTGEDTIVGPFGCGCDHGGGAPLAALGGLALALLRRRR